MTLAGQINFPAKWLAATNIKTVSRECHCAIGEFFIRQRNGATGDKIRIDLEPAAILVWDSEMFWLLTSSDQEEHEHSDTEDIIVYSDSDSDSDDDGRINMNGVRPESLRKKKSVRVNEFSMDRIIKAANAESVNNVNINIKSDGEIKVEPDETVDISDDAFLRQVILDEREKNDETVRVADIEFQRLIEAREHFRGVRDYSIFISDEDREQ